MSKPVVPTMGRIVLFRPRRPATEDMPAIIRSVGGDKQVDLTVFEDRGERHVDDVPLVRDPTDLKRRENDPDVDPFTWRFPPRV